MADDPTDVAARRAWTLLHTFAAAHDRHGELADTLGFRLGGGRGKVLFGLRDEARTLAAIAEAHGVPRPYATLIVDQLEQHGLVERRPHPQDRRSKLVSLTAAGRDAVATAEAIVLRPPPELARLSAAELDQLTGLLARVLGSDAALD